MKRIKFLGLMLIAAMAVVFTSCTDMQRLKMDIKASNEDLPEDWGDGQTCTKIQLHGDYVEYIIQCDEIDEDGEEYSVADLNDPEIKNGMKEEIIESFKNHESKEDVDYYNDFMELVKPCRVGLEFRYIGKRTGGECTIRIEYWELP
ncbi:MAG: hypothetical protein J6U04_04905 [Salinivirgaceae bacterium]|nr:hypothetical protein [Salinivirgaceae bacterium]